MKKYDKIISLGSQCNPGLILRDLKLKKETYPFDWIRSNTKIIYDVLINGYSKYLSFDTKKSNDYYTKDLDSNDYKDFNQSHINYYGQYFIHYTKINVIELKKKFDRYFKRFFDILQSNFNILFIHTHEEYIYHKKSRDNRVEFYNYLCKINDFLKIKYPNLKFTILNININENIQNYGNIINKNLSFNIKRFSDNGELSSNEKSIKYFRKYNYNIVKKWLEE